MHLKHSFGSITGRRLRYFGGLKTDHRIFFCIKPLGAFSMIVFHAISGVDGGNVNANIKF